MAQSLMWATKILAACVGAVGIGILFRLPPRYLPAAAFSGACTWLVVMITIQTGGGRFASGFLGAATAALLAEVGARRLRIPATLLVVPALVLLVPGADAYFAMLAFLQGNDAQGVAVSVQTFIAALSIAAGVAATVSMWRARKTVAKKLVHGKK